MKEKNNQRMNCPECGKKWRTHGDTFGIVRCDNWHFWPLYKHDDK